VFADPQVLARGMRSDVSDRGGELLPGLAAPLVLDGTRMGTGKASPRLGEDSGAGWRERPKPR
jgi:crotonobetainyl-CoA:carnitine CoA-transferase CaiB-like acyl-CoA transferase